MRNIHEFEVKNLLRMANDAKERAYVPYSGFRVGACLKGPGRHLAGYEGFPVTIRKGALPALFTLICKNLFRLCPLRRVCTF